MTRHRPFGFAGLHGAITGEPQLYLHDPSASAAGPDAPGTDVLPSSARQSAFGRFAAWALRHLKRSPEPEPVVRNAGRSASGFAP
jgi:hypothetical protein